MIKLQIKQQDLADGYRQGDEIAGTVRWELEEVPKSVELQLFWFTSGKGTEDIQIADTIYLENPLMQEERDFSFICPEGPYSFSGSLISLQWAIEAIVEPSEETSRKVIVISHTGNEVEL